MGANNVVDSVGSAVQEYVEHRDDASRRLVEQTIQSSGILNNKEQLAELNRQLESTGLLPKLLQQELSSIDTWHVSINPFSDISTGPANRALERSEMQDVVDNAGSYRGATVLAAQFGLDRYSRIKESGDFGQEWLSYGISSDMIDRFVRREDENGKLRSADEVFSGNLDDSRTGGHFSANGEYVNPHPESDADLPAGWVAKNGKPVNLSNYKDFRGMSDADMGGDQRSTEYSDQYTIGDREFSRNQDGQWSYTIKHGDTLNTIARAVLRNRLGYEPDESRVEEYSKRVAHQNEVRDLNKIYADHCLVIPSIDY